MMLSEEEAMHKLCWMSDWVAGEHYCEGSKCMAWRWLPQPLDVLGLARSGYCGPAGKPEE